VAAGPRHARNSAIEDNRFMIRSAVFPILDKNLLHSLGREIAEIPVVDHHGRGEKARAQAGHRLEAEQRL
jgi:hypothetical protein